jgi:ankyrin repeat protein
MIVATFLRVTAALTLTLLTGPSCTTADAFRSNGCQRSQFPLHHAIQAGDKALLDKLLSNGRPLNDTCDLDALHMQKTTPLMMAVYTGNVYALRELLGRGVSITGDSNNQRVLNILSDSWQLKDRDDIASILIDAKVDLNYNHGGTPLILAATRGYMNIIKLLMAKGADINARYQGQTALFAATQYQRLEMAKLLLSAGATISDEDFIAAAFRCNLLMLHYYLKNGGDIEVRSKHGVTALQSGAREGYTECVELLLDRGADINARDSSGNTALHGAVASGRVTAWLLEKSILRGADINAKNSKGQTPLDLAQGYHDDASANLLLKAGARNGGAL